jgi:hypothetical protein
MKPILTLALSILAVAGTALSASCWDRGAEAAAAEVLEMRVYSVPAGQSKEVQSMLKSALVWGDNPVGRVSSGPGDTLVVVAPAKIHAGIAGLVGELGKMGKVGNPPDVKQVTVNYWMIVGRPIEKAPSGKGYVVSGDSRLTSVEPALATIVQTQGPMEFSLMERVQITTLNSGRGRAHGRTSIIEQRISDVGGRLTGDVQLIVGQNQLETRVALDPGQLLVMAQVGYRGKTGEVFDGPGSDDITLYYVMAGQ